MGRFDPDYELPLMRDVRAAVPKNVRLMVDAWGSYTLPTALRVGRALEEMDFYWYEEPHRPERLPRLRGPDLRRWTSRSPAARTSQSREAAKALFDRRAVDILQPDVSLCGGIADFLFMAELAAPVRDPLHPALVELGDHRGGVGPGRVAAARADAHARRRRAR